MASVFTDIVIDDTNLPKFYVNQLSPRTTVIRMYTEEYQITLFIDAVEAFASDLRHAMEEALLLHRESHNEVSH